MKGNTAACFGVLSLWWLAHLVQGSTPAQVSCATGWLYNLHHNTCVKAVKSKVTWFNARDACSEEESTLLHVDSDDMGNFIGNDIKNTGILSTGDRLWIASNDIMEEAVMRSVFRRSINYTDWDPTAGQGGQPNDASDGPLHSQNCVMDIVNASLHKQQDKSCAYLYFYVCELWPRDRYTAVFNKTNMDGSLLVNYGLGSEADDMYPVTTVGGCAARCLKKHFFCEVFLYSGNLQRCQLLRLYQQGHAKALTAAHIDELMVEGYRVFAISAFDL